MTEFDKRAPYNFVVGKDTGTTYVEYRGERMPGQVAAAVVVGDMGDILDVNEDERAYLLLKIRMPYVRIQRDERTLHGGEIPTAPREDDVHLYTVYAGGKDDANGA